jgi:hypothetical protein
MSKKPVGPLGPFTRFLLMAVIASCMVFASGVAALRVYPGASTSCRWSKGRAAGFAAGGVKLR